MKHLIIGLNFLVENPQAPWKIPSFDCFNHLKHSFLFIFLIVVVVVSKECKRAGVKGV